MKHFLLAAATLAALAASASADELILRNGSSFSGAVRESGDKVTIEMDLGTMTFKKVDVRSIVRGDDVVKTFEEKSAKADGARGLVEVALWGRENGLRNRADDLLDRVLRLDPDQPDARKALGYERVGGRWLRGDDLKTAQGMVKLEGKWLAGGDAQRELDRREGARIESDRNAMEARIADQKHEEEMVRLALERERIEIERKAAEKRGADLDFLRAELDRMRWESTYGAGYPPPPVSEPPAPVAPVSPVTPPPAAPPAAPAVKLTQNYRPPVVGPVFPTTPPRLERREDKDKDKNDEESAKKR